MSTIIGDELKNIPWQETQEKLASGEIQIITYLSRRDQIENKFVLSKVPYASTQYTIISRADFTNLASYQVPWAKVGFVKDDKHINLYQEMFSKNTGLIEYGTRNKGLEALTKGEIDLFITPEYTLLDQNNYRENPIFKMNVKLNMPIKSYFGFNKNDAVLCSVISKAQQFVNTAEIETNWTERVFDYSTKIAHQRSLYLLAVLIITFSILLITVFILIKNTRLRKKLEQLASHDYLTGVFNRRYFMEQAEIQMSRADRLKSGCFIAILDLDHFKRINDTYGHSAGDKVLKEVLKLVKNTVRTYDLVGRYGGEEFIIFMSDTDKENAINAVERIRKAICAEPVEYDDKQIPVTASFGIACISSAEDLEKAFGCADEALDRAKKGGRNRAVFYE